MEPVSRIARSLIAGFLFGAALFTCACATGPAQLDIYFVDVEGGQATLVVTPVGETLLIDAGYPGQGKSDPVPGDAERARDAQRIAAAAADADASRIDFLLVTHFHADHFGGVMELAQLLPIDTIIDHGTEDRETRSNAKTLDLIRAYKDVRAKHTYLTPIVGDHLPLEGAEVTVVSSAGKTLESPVDGAGTANPSCDRPALSPSEPIENPRSIGILLRFGEFRFLDLGDLAGQPLSDLVCPINRVGAMDVYLVPHHGAADSADPATFAAIRPRVAVLNNGAQKGGHPAIFRLLKSTEGLEDVWQLDRSEDESADNFPSEQIANLASDTAYWIRLSARRDGSFRVMNSRTGVWKEYEARPTECQEEDQ
jgi:beta-lactamase superfamily II metal-dependent hydrolase